MSQDKPDGQLCVIWTSRDREVALKMAFMYTPQLQAEGLVGQSPPGRLGPLGPTAD